MIYLMILIMHHIFFAKGLGRDGRPRRGADKPAGEEARRGGGTTELVEVLAQREVAVSSETTAGRFTGSRQRAGRRRWGSAEGLQLQRGAVGVRTRSRGIGPRTARPWWALRWCGVPGQGSRRQGAERRGRRRRKDLLPLGWLGWRSH